MTIREASADRVRYATRCDHDQILDLCRRNHAENGLGAFAADKVANVLRRAFDPGRNDLAIIGVVGTDHIEGSVGLVVDQPWDGDTSILVGLWNYVLPEHRHKPHFKDLTAFAKRQMEPAPVGIGLPLWMGAIVTPRTEPQVRMYRRQLGEPVSITWLCESWGGTP